MPSTRTSVLADQCADILAPNQDDSERHARILGLEDRLQELGFECSASAIFSTPKVAKILGVHLSTVQRMCDRGELKYSLNAIDKRAIPMRELIRYVLLKAHNVFAIRGD